MNASENFWPLSSRCLRNFRVQKKWHPLSLALYFPNGFFCVCAFNNNARQMIIICITRVYLMSAFLYKNVVAYHFHNVAYLWHLKWNARFFMTSCNFFYSPLELFFSLTYTWVNIELCVGRWNFNFLARLFCSQIAWNRFILIACIPLIFSHSHMNWCHENFKHFKEEIFAST